jgi:hypothetical protein
MLDLIKPKNKLDIQVISLDVKQRMREKKIRKKGESRTEALVNNSEVFNKLEDWIFEQEKPVQFQSIQSSLEEFEIQVTVEQWKLLLKAGGKKLFLSLLPS